jgi:hypothetical protein
VVGFEIDVADARPQNQMLSRKRRCWTAKSFPAQQSPMLYSRFVSRAATAFYRARDQRIHHHCPHMNPHILLEDLPKEIRPPSDVADPGKGLYEREFAAFQKSLFERISAPRMVTDTLSAVCRRRMSKPKGEGSPTRCRNTS